MGRIRSRSRRRRRSRGRDWIRGGVLSPRAGWGTLKRSMCCLFSLPPAAPFLAIRRLRSFASYLSTLVKVAWHFTVVMSTYVYVCVLVSCSLCLCLCVCASFSLSHCSCVCVCESLPSFRFRAHFFAPFFASDLVPRRSTLTKDCSFTV